MCISPGIIMFLLMVSCNKNDYRSSVPRGSSWVLSVNMSSVEKKIQKENTLIQDFLFTTDVLASLCFRTDF